MITAYEYHLSGAGVWPRDIGYPLYAAITTRLPQLHGRKGLQIAPVSGKRTEDSKGMILDRRSTLHIRGLSLEEAVALQKQVLIVASNLLTVGAFSRRDLTPGSKLCSRLVIYKDLGDCEEGAFLSRLMSELVWLGCEPGDMTITLGKIRSLAFKGRHYRGRSVEIVGGDPDLILGRGLGSFKSMGCGIFRPYTREINATC